MRNSRNALYGSLLLLPAAVLLWTFTYQPILTTLYHSFFSTTKGKRAAVFIGVDNYARMIDDPVFWQALSNNIVYALVTIPVSMALALAMALFVNGRLVGQGIVRMAYFTPTVLPMVAVANIWLFFYAPSHGPIDQFLGLFGLGHNNLLGTPDTALWALIVITIWKEAGFFMIFYLAALQQISPTLIEAARLEGATAIQVFRRVTVPLIMPTTLFVMVNALIGAFRLVDHVIALTKGGPDNATTLLLFYLYEVGFQYWDTSYAAALTVFLLVVLAVIALFQFGYLDKKVHYR
ncbi:carbohydrate ABC transporter permease [Ensifer sp. YR511]|uniref:carbohydrate ABC transporter permease n=1 Tax=Ensifer sp. YR511 TaxID=1855294 RepID=UPI000891EF83|nr:sugar ABC transporter permease [Ensifer sp. YR511]SDN02251.1 sn-glycerol 3-phosphate transport system permease protein [Ensifer sp. YR511]